MASYVARGNVASSSNAHAALLCTPELDYDDDDDGHNDDDDDDDDDDDGHNDEEDDDNDDNGHNDDDDDHDGGEGQEKKSMNLLFCLQTFLSFRH